MRLESSFQEGLLIVPSFIYIIRFVGKKIKMAEKYKLSFEIIPSAAWNVNLRTVFPKKVWDFIRKDAYERANGKCSICGEKVNRLEAHERWSFDKKNKIQKLEDVIGICHLCHMVIHIGRTQLIGQEDVAINHFKKVNRCDYQGYINELKRANEVNIDLSKIDEWNLDLTWLQRFNNN